MALDDTENLDTPEESGNGDEQSNRTFRILALVLGGIGMLGLILIGATLLTQNSERQRIIATNQAVQATNQAVEATGTAITALALNPPTAAPTNTPEPTNTLPPTTAPRPTTAPTRVPPTAAGTQAPAAPGAGDQATEAPAGGTPASGAGSAGQTTEVPAAGTPASGAGPAGQATSAPSGGASTQATSAPTGGAGASASSGVTTTQTTTDTAKSDGKLPQGGAGDSLGFLALAGGLVAVLIVARRMRMSQV